MAIFFDTIPTGRLTPFTFVEFSNRLRDNLSNTQTYKCLMFGQKEAIGIAKENDYIIVNSLKEAALNFGVNSSIYKSYESFRKNNHDTVLVLCAQNEPQASTASKNVFTVTGTASDDSSITIIDRNIEYRVAVSTGETADDIAANIAKTAIPGFTITSATNTVTFESTTKGALSSLFYHEIKSEDPAVTISAGVKTSGTGAVDLTDALTNIPAESFNIIISNYNDDANIAKFKELLADRWGAEKQLDGILFTHQHGTVADIVKLKPANKSRYIVNVACVEPNRITAYETVAAYAAVVAKYAQVDPARPFQTLELIGITPKKLTETLTVAERELLLTSGFATYITNKFGETVIERAVTSYLKNSAYRDLNVSLILSYLRFDFRNRIQQKFPRHKLARDNERFTANQPIVTPLIARAEAMSVFNNWETLGLIQNVEVLKNTLAVEIDGQDSTRLNMSLPVDLVNQLRITAVQVNFAV